MKKIFLLTILSFISLSLYCQEKTHAISFKVSVDENIQQSFKQDGRLFIFISTDPNKEPRTLMWPNSIDGNHYFFGKNFSDWKANESLTIKDSDDWTTWGRIQECTFQNIPEGTYYIQFLWDQDFEAFGLNVEGNICSKSQKIMISDSQELTFELSEIIEPLKIVEHKHIKIVKHKSDTLSKWWGRPIYERAAVLLPSDYFENPGKEYPIRYNVGGGFGSLDRVNRWVNEGDKATTTMKADTAFFNWWLSGEAPQIITVYLDGELNGNIYHVDSDNLGPFGYSLINEFIPHIENLYRGTDSPDTRFTDGCSTGGWGSLALQLFYPETFNGVFSYSPDCVTFRTLFTTNIYLEKNLFNNKYGYENAAVRTMRNSMDVSIKDWVEFENVLGYSGTYIDSDQWFGVMTSLFGDIGEDGKPIPIFDHETGIIDSVAAARWRRYDLLDYTMNNWETLGPKLQGKIYIWMGTEDIVYSNIALKIFKTQLSRLENPTPNLLIEFTPNHGHCWQWNNRRVLKQIAERLNKIDTE